MARAYADDLRRKIFEAHGKGHGSFRKLAELFGVSLGYVEKIFRQRARTGKAERIPHRSGRKPRVTAEMASRIVELVGAHSDITIASLQERVASETGVAMSWSTMRRSVKRLGLRLKKSRSTPASATRKQTFNGVRSSSKRSAPFHRTG